MLGQRSSYLSTDNANGKLFLPAQANSAAECSRSPISNPKPSSFSRAVRAALAPARSSAGLSRKAFAVGDRSLSSPGGDGALVAPDSAEEARAACARMYITCGELGFEKEEALRTKGGREHGSACLIKHATASRSCCVVADLSGRNNVADQHHGLD